MIKLLAITLFIPVTLARSVYDASSAATGACRDEWRALKKVLRRS